MEALVEKSCTPCRGGVPPLTSEEAESLRGQLPEWALQDDAHRIERSFRFGNFREALRSWMRSANWLKPKGIIPTSTSAGVTR